MAGTTGAARCRWVRGIKALYSVGQGPGQGRQASPRFAVGAGAGLRGGPHAVRRTRCLDEPTATAVLQRAACSRLRGPRRGRGGLLQEAVLHVVRRPARLPPPGPIQIVEYTARDYGRPHFPDAATTLVLINGARGVWVGWGWRQSSGKAASGGGGECRGGWRFMWSLGSERELGEGAPCVCRCVCVLVSQVVLAPPPRRGHASGRDVVPPLPLAPSAPSHA